MSEQQKPQVRDEEPELNDEAVEQVAGGCQWGQSGMQDQLTVLITPTFPIIDMVAE
jgi:hypothetical protein